MFRTLPRRTLVDYCHCGIPTRHTIGTLPAPGPPLKNRHCDISSRGGEGMPSRQPVRRVHERISMEMKPIDIYEFLAKRRSNPTQRATAMALR